MNENNDKMDKLIELQKQSLLQLSKINNNVLGQNLMIVVFCIIIVALILMLK
tara:strand:+ start:2440 stop:2595 length:156 start_codon:yes stop_codon:yes gene_type:complete